MKSALLGVDIGTTNLKTVAFSTDGRQFAKASVPTPTNYPRPDWAEFDHDALWGALAGTIRDAIDGLPRETKPTAIAFTGMAEAGLPLDENDKPLYPAITWFDRRVLPQMEDWRTCVGEEKTARLTGLPLSPAAGILRLLWLRDNEPELFARTKSWLNLPDYAAFRLCGEKVTEYSLASRMMAFDLDQKSWSSELLDKCEIDQRLFGSLAGSSTQIGTVHADAATLTGLPEGLPVCTGGHDHLCAAVGLGVTSADDLFDSIGTAEAIIAATPSRNSSPTIAASGIAQGVHVLPNRYYAISGNTFGGGSIEWTRSLLQGALPESARSFSELSDLASNVPAGSGGVFFLPHLRRANPPIDDPASRGAFVGLSSDSTPGHLARAVLEGLAFEFQRIQDAVSDSFNLSCSRLVAAGGGTRNRLFMQIKSDVSGLPIVVPDVEEATCLGAALAAGIGSGIYGDYDDAAAQVRYSEIVVEPDGPTHDLYRTRYEAVYLKLYDSLKSINHEISNWITVESNNESSI